MIKKNTYVARHRVQYSTKYVQMYLEYIYLSLRPIVIHKNKISSRLNKFIICLYFLTVGQNGYNAIL